MKFLIFPLTTRIKSENFVQIPSKIPKCHPPIPPDQIKNQKQSNISWLMVEHLRGASSDVINYILKIKLLDVFDI